MKTTDEQTIADFGEQWTKFPELQGFFASTDIFRDIAGPLIDCDGIRGLSTMDIGSGSGRYTNILLDLGASRVIAVEPSDAMAITQSNTAARAGQVDYVLRPAHLIERYNEVDLAISIGVLHHIVDPAPSVRAVHDALKPGGRFMAWLYGREGNETYLGFVLPVRRFTRSLPHCVLKTLSMLLTPPLIFYIWLCRWLPLPLRAYMRNVLAHLTPAQLCLNIYDQLKPAHAKYYTGATAGNIWFIARDRTMLRCPACAAIWVAEGLAVDTAGVSIYESDQPIFFEDQNETYYLGEAALTNARAKLDVLRAHVPHGGSLLDVGAGFGHFLKVCGDFYRAVGAEVSPVAVEWSRREFGVENLCASIDALGPLRDGPYDAVTLWDVVEHLPDVDLALREIRLRLRPGGKLIISTPDAGSIVARLLGRRWHYLDPVQHILLFNRRNLTSLLARHGFEVVAVGSMGHRYRLDYVFARLFYFYRDTWLGRPLALIARLIAPIGSRTVSINPHDVLTMVATKRD